MWMNEDVVNSAVYVQRMGECILSFMLQISAPNYQLFVIIKYERKKEIQAKIFEYCETWKALGGD